MPPTNRPNNKRSSPIDGGDRSDRQHPSTTTGIDTPDPNLDDDEEANGGAVTASDTAADPSPAPAAPPLTIFGGMPGAYSIRGPGPDPSNDNNNRVIASSGNGDDELIENGDETLTQEPPVEVLEAYTVPSDTDFVSNLAPAPVQVEAPLVEAVPVPTDNGPVSKTRGRMVIGCSMLLLCVVGAAVGTSVYVSNSTSDGNEDREDPASPTPMKVALPPVLETLKERKVLRCGVNPDDLSGFSLYNNVTKMREGFEIDFCNAVAAAALGSRSYRVETIVVTPVNRFVKLESGEVDLVVAATTHTFERDVHQPSTGTGFSFSAPYLYGGLVFGGVPKFVSCADDLSAVGECADLMICVIPGTTWNDVVGALFPGSNIALVEVQTNSVQGLIDDTCNVIVGEQYQAPEGIVRSYGYEGPYAVGQKSFSKEPLALVTRDGDDEFAEFVNRVLQGLLYAEAQNVTMETADTFIKTGLFGEEYEHMFQDAVAAVGNYGEIYSRHLDHVSYRLKVNMLNKGNTGLLYSHPFGHIDTIGPGPVEDGVIERIVQRGFLRCGSKLEDDAKVDTMVPSEKIVRLGTEYCSALAAIVFKGKTDKISFETFPETTDYENISQALEAGDIDVYVGEGLPMTSDVRVQGVSFSLPYFYDEAPEVNSTAGGKTYLLATTEDDAQWTDLVYWVIMATFYAEENDITQSTYNEMPVISLFGSDLERALRDTILAVGNYGEMHTRIFGQDAVSRVGRNLLNEAPFGPQHFPTFG